MDSEWPLKGRHNLCDKGTFMGANTKGAFADYVLVDKSQLVEIPDNMSYDMAALLEPLPGSYAFVFFLEIQEGVPKSA